MCFSLGWLQSLLVYLVIIAAIIALLRLLLPYVLNALGAGGGVIQGAINIVLWAIVAIFVIYIVFGLISCLAGAGSLSLLPHR